MKCQLVKILLIWYFNSSVYSFFYSKISKKSTDLVGLVAWRVSSYFHPSFSPISSPCGFNFLSLQCNHLHLPNLYNLSKSTVKIRWNQSHHQTDQVQIKLYFTKFENFILVWSVVIAVLQQNNYTGISLKNFWR